VAAPDTVTWPLEPHTQAKHAILRRYLQAWIPILTLGGAGRPRDVLYIDGFAGPGRYTDGEDGSPIIALRAALEAGIPPQKARLVFFFVEKDADRAAHLEQCIAELGCPPHFRTRVVREKPFAEAFGELVTFYRSWGMKLPPTFALIDPFGWTGAPFSIVRTIMGYERCEVMVNFMYEEVNRFLGHPDQGANFDEFFGTSDWRAAIELKDPRARNQALHGLYARQLGTVARYVRSFQMKNARNQTDYYLFYATNHLQGLRKMKEAMWRVDESGAFTFSDATDSAQLVLFNTPDFATLERQLVQRFAGQEATVGEVEEFVLAETAFRETHYKARLKGLEGAGRLEAVNPARGRRAGTFSDPDMRLRFR
jgi:three-Cys-motif partner protein